jgi:hypothetical protein
MPATTEAVMIAIAIIILVRPVRIAGVVKTQLLSFQE